MYTAHFYDEEDAFDVSEDAVPVWQVLFPDGTIFDVTAETYAQYLTCSPSLNGDELKVICARDYSLIGNTFLVRVSDANHNRVSTVEVEVVG